MPKWEKLQIMGLGQNFNSDISGSVHNIDVPMRQALLFRKASYILLLSYCATAALSIAASQTIVVVLLLLWFWFRVSGGAVAGTRPAGEVEGNFVVAIVLWVIASSIAAMVGVNPVRAFTEVAKSSLYVLLPICVYDSVMRTGADKLSALDKVYHYLLAFLFGQTLAGIHSVISAIKGAEVAPHIPGPVTESGQIALLLPIWIGVVVSSISQVVNDESNPSRIRIPDIIIGVLSTLSLLLICWPQMLSLHGAENVRIVCGALLAMIICGAIWIHGVSIRALTKRQLIAVMLPIASALVVVAFLVNLKRGPWFGVLVTFALLGLLVSRRLLLLLVFVGITLFSVAEPIRNRILDYNRDFTISGGRQNMWALGTELVQRFPLGLGPDNAKFMRQVDPSLPPSHRHMHNNILNVAVESGLIGLVAFIWWIYLTVAMGLRCWLGSLKTSSVERKRYGLLALSLAFGILSWQLAGIVEYNFGDGEIRLIAFVVMGFLLICAAQRNEGQARS